MTDTKHCRWCNTLLEWTQNSKRWTFTAHTEQFCRDATRQRVKDLELAIKSVHENYHHQFERYVRRMDEYLAEHGLPTSKEQAAQAERQARYLMTKLDLKPIRFE